MKWRNGCRMRLCLVGLAAATVLGGVSAKADFTFGEATCVDKVINNGTNVQECSFLHDGLKLYFSYNLPGGYGNRDLWVSTREAHDAAWQEPINLGPNVNGPNAETYPAISPDELEIYFQYGNGPGLMRSTRASKDEPWGSPTTYTDLGDVYDLDFSPDGLTVYFDAMGLYGGWDICMATRESVDAPWGERVNLGPNVNDSGDQFGPSISNDGLVLFFYKNLRIYMTKRATKDDSWGPSVYLSPSVNGYGWVHGPEVSPDGSVLYFDSNANRPGGHSGENFWQVPILPIVDFNVDGNVDIDDLVILIDNWGTSETLCDIGPMPWGDGIVDEVDLKVFMSHWGQEAYDPALIACWKLDEAKGNTAYDSAGTNDAAVLGNPVWQPEGGAVDGAIALDGMDDYLEAPFVLNPSDATFSVFTWVKGDAPGQVIVSQLGAADWLMADAEGKLMTQLMGPGRDACPLGSQTLITDGQWHRIAFVRDGSRRSLYVDGTMAAEDTQGTLPSSTKGLYIGCGKAMGPGTFWSGLIDDVRVYNRAVRP